MPNIIHNVMKIDDGEKAKEVYAAMKTEESEFDFNAVMPVPAEKEGDEKLEWCTKNWGSKWNAMDPVMLDDRTVYFQTAWSDVKAVVIELARKFNVHKLGYQWASEFRDDECGYIRIANRRIAATSFKGSKMACKKFNERFFEKLEAKVGPIEVPDLSEENGWREIELPDGQKISIRIHDVLGNVIFGNTPKDR